MILIDERATNSQRGRWPHSSNDTPLAAGEVVRVASLPIEMKFDPIDMECSLEAGKEARLVTRRLVPRDRCCTNEEYFLPTADGG